jgi:hypothetical protein
MSRSGGPLRQTSVGARRAPWREEELVKFLLIMHNNPAIWDALTESEREAVMSGHARFMETVRASGELVLTQALAEPARGAVVRVRGGEPVVTDGPYLEAKEYLGGYYLVECASRDRAVELAAMIPDASLPGLGIEVRPVIFEAGPEG